MIVRNTFRSYWNTMKRYIKERLLHIRATPPRTENVARDVYRGNYENESNEMFMGKRQQSWYNGALAVYPVIEYKRRLLLYFATIIQTHRVDSLLELGSGRGFNVLSLAIMCPCLSKIHGVELTANGVAAARENLKHPPYDILEFLTGRSKKEIDERLASVDIAFTEGSIRAIPLPDRSFDGVFSNSVIEQFPRDYNEAFREAARIARRIGFFSEPFREAQRGNIFKRMYLSNIDYFQGSFLDVEKVGWTVLQFEIPLFQKYVFNTGILVCRKNLEKK